MLTSLGFTVTAGLLPAFSVDPVKYGNLDLSYLEATIQSGVEFLLFYGPNVHYNRTFILQDYTNRGTITLGEAASGALVPTAPQYKGPVLVIDGEQDVVFCGFLGLELLGTGNCGVGSASKPALTKIIYPAANYSVSSYSIPPSLTSVFSCRCLIEQHCCHLR
jgi:hypothetical protein